MNADRYHGAVARGYDAKREGKPGWEREHKAVADMVTDGPVLDIPFGTGRYVPIYTDKGIDFLGIDVSSDMLAQAERKFPEAKTERGSVFKIPYPAGHFATVVCSRLLNWLYPDDMVRAVAELRRVAPTLVVSIRTGKPDERPSGNYTHSLARFYEAIDGLFIEERRIISERGGDTFEMFRLRPPEWSDVLRQFDKHPDKHDAINRLAAEWCARYGGLEQVDLVQGAVKAEYWTNEQLGLLLDHMQNFPRRDGKRNRMTTDQKPRHLTGALTVFRTQGRTALIDGRRRANIWRNKPGRYPVLAVEVEPDEAAPSC